MTTRLNVILLPQVRFKATNAGIVTCDLTTKEISTDMRKMITTTQRMFRNAPINRLSLALKLISRPNRKALFRPLNALNVPNYLTPNTGFKLISV
jgi:hypothetical protein